MLDQVVNDHKLRSDCIRTLVHNHKQQETFRYEAVPKVVVQFWDNLNMLPDDVKSCIDSWTPLEKIGFKRLLFDEVLAETFLKDEFSKIHLEAFRLCHHPAMKCDYFRLAYLSKYGGFYVDSDEFYLGEDISKFFNTNLLHVSPLCYDNATAEMIQADSFLTRKEYAGSWTFYFNNNPIISPPNHPVIRMAFDRATTALVGSRGNKLDIQSTTGPGNLTVSIAYHALRKEFLGEPLDFLVIDDWHKISTSVWPLSYRNDKRNWRLWNHTCE